MMDGTYLEVAGCLWAALVDLLGGVMNFKIVMVLGTEFTLVLVNVEGLRGGGGGGGEEGAPREPMDSNRSFPVMSTLNIVLATLGIFRHMLNFRSSVSCFGLG